MPLITITTNAKDVLRALTRFQDDMGTGCQVAVKKGVREGVDEMLASRRWKDKTGDTARATRGQLTVQRREGAEGRMDCAVEHASYLKDGTVPHIIRPKAIRGSPKASRHPGQSVRALNDIGTTRISLRWYDAGGMPVFRKEVHHPGTTADSFWDKGVEQCETTMKREIEVAFIQADRKFQAA